jgi:hypothetical protein
MTNRIILIVPILLLLPHLASAAGNDFQLWTEAGATYELNKQFRLKFGQHLRFEENASGVDTTMPQLSVSCRPLKHLRLEAGYRFIAEPRDDDAADNSAVHGTFYRRHRLFGDVRLRFRFKPITLRYRLRYQEQFGKDFENDPDEEFGWVHTVRNKLELELKLPAGFEPFVSTELFNRLGEKAYQRDQELYKWRLTAGLEYTLDAHQLTLFYRLEIYLADNTWGGDDIHEGDQRHILGLGYQFNF